MYSYKEGDLSQEELYLKNKLVAFFQELGYVGGVIPPNVASKNRLKICIQTYWVANAKSNEERKKVYGEWPKGLAFVFCILESSLMSHFLIV